MAKGEAKEADGEEAKGGGKKKLIIIALPVLILVLAAAYFLVLKPKDSSGAAAKLPAPTPGAVVPLDSSITVNLVGAHYLKIGLALQPTASAKETDGSKALDQVITVFSNQTVDKLSSEEGRDALKEELVARIKLAYLPEGKLTEEEITKANQAASGGKVKETDDLTAAQAEKRAAALTVQPDVYDVYFTEFVLQ